MSKSSKILTGILAFLPLLLFIGYIVMFFSFMFDMFMNIQTASAQIEDPTFFLSSFIGMFVLLGIMGLVSIVKLIYFIIHITNNPKLDSNERIIWVLVGVFVGMFGFPIYWYLKIWKEE